MDPGEGELACHWYGKGRLPELNEVVEKMEDLLSPKDLKGEQILITGGPTQEPIDPVRFIAPRSRLDIRTPASFLRETGWRTR